MRDAARATSLLTADAIPACSAGTAASTVEVSGTGAPPASSASTWCRWSNSRLLDEPAGSGLDGRLPLDSAFLGPTSSPHVPDGDPLSGGRDLTLVISAAARRPSKGGAAQYRRPRSRYRPAIWPSREPRPAGKLTFLTVILGPLMESYLSGNDVCRAAHRADIPCGAEARNARFLAG